jgi:hypothetical protein
MTDAYQNRIAPLCPGFDMTFLTARGRGFLALGGSRGARCPGCRGGECRVAEGTACAVPRQIAPPFESMLFEAAGR